MNTYDEGKDGEETSIHTTRKIGSENKNKVFTEEEKADYLKNIILKEEENQEFIILIMKELLFFIKKNLIKK